MQLCLQQLGHGSNLEIHQQIMDKEAVVHLYNGILLSHKKEFESVLMRWMNLEPIIQSEVSRKEKNKQPNQILEKDINRHFFKEDIQMANKDMKICSTLLIISKTQIKTSMRYHITPVRMTIIKKSTNNKCWSGNSEKGRVLEE